MAYDPYDRGDNPWIGNLDMPRSNPGARPGASRAASLAPAKKKKSNLAEDPDLRDVRWTNGKITRDAPASPPRRPAGLGGGVPLPPRRPLGIGGASGRGPESTAEILTSGAGEHDYATGKPMKPGYTLDPERFSTPLRTTGPEMTINPDERNVPPPAIPGGILAGPPPNTPERSVPLAPPNTAPPVQQIMNSAANNPALRPTQTTGIDQAGAGILDFLRSQLFNQGRPVQ